MSTLEATAAIRLPRADGTIRPHQLGRPGAFTRPQAPLTSRVFFAAAHVVPDVLHEPDASGRARLDWDATLAFRRHLWSYGLGVAEAMDTAQRGAGLDWPAARELIHRSTAEARTLSGAIACGAGTDQLEPLGGTLAEVREAYLEQCQVVEGEGAQIVLMASRALTTAARSADDYLEVYGSVLAQLKGRVILHWLGEMFDPQLAGYWGSRDVSEAMDTVVALIEQHARRIDGIKISLLDAAREVELRRRLPAGVRLYTGDDLDYPRLIRGDGTHASDALLGIFDAIAPAASTALQALDGGETERFDAVLEPTVALSRQIFSAPTFAYKTGIVLLAWLNGHQPAFRMVRGAESARSLVHLSETFVLADRAGLLADPELATARMRGLLRLAGIDA